MKAPKILIIDDDIDLYTVYKKAISPIINSTFASTFNEGFKLINTEDFDLILLDIYLEQDMSLELLEYHSKEDSRLLDKIILITGKGKIDDEIRGHKLGVRDYINKPLNIPLFKVIIEKHLHQILNKDEKIMIKGPFYLDLYKHQISIMQGNEKKDLDLTLLEYKFLKVFILSEGRVLNREQLTEKVWEGKKEQPERAIDMHISCIRKKLGKFSKFLKTKRSHGYILEV